MKRKGMRIELPVKSAIKSEVSIETVASIHEDTSSLSIDGILRRPFWFRKNLNQLLK